MQVKLVITTIAFMLTAIVFGYAALREPARMELFEEAFDARNIEYGATIYYNNCSTCHGEEGKAEVCYDGEGEQIGCAGRALNTASLLCSEPSARLGEMQWEGTKEGYIIATVNAGRAQNGMPTWGAQYGGPLEPYQVEQVTAFVLNWETEALCSEPPPPPFDWPTDVASLPAGDAANGEQLYNIEYGCSACHGDLVNEASAAVGPWAGAFADLTDVRQPGYTAAEYVYESILNPSDYIAAECPTGPCAGPPSAMPNNFGERMNGAGKVADQEMADIMAFLLGSPTFESNGNEIIFGGN